MTKSSIEEWEDKLYTMIHRECECLSGNIKKCNWDEIFYFIRSLLTQSRQEVIEEVRNEIMNIELALDKKTINKVEALKSKAEVVGYTQGLIFSQIDKILQSLKDK